MSTQVLWNGQISAIPIIARGEFSSFSRFTQMSLLLQVLFNTRIYTGILLGNCNFGIFHSGITRLEDGEVPLHDATMILWGISCLLLYRLQVKNTVKLELSYGQRLNLQARTVIGVKKRERENWRTLALATSFFHAVHFHLTVIVSISTLPH